MSLEDLYRQAYGDEQWTLTNDLYEAIYDVYYNASGCDYDFSLEICEAATFLPDYTEVIDTDPARYNHANGLFTA